MWKKIAVASDFNIRPVAFLRDDIECSAYFNGLEFFKISGFCLYVAVAFYYIFITAFTTVYPRVDFGINRSGKSL